MKITKKSDGITTRIIRTVTSDDDPKVIMEVMECMIRFVPDYLKGVRAWAEPILKDAGLPTDPLQGITAEDGSQKLAISVVTDDQSKPEYYAADLVFRAHQLEAAIDEKRLEDAVYNALFLGDLWREAQMKFRFRDDIVTGRTTREQRIEFGRRGADEQWEDQRQLHKEWQYLAAEIRTSYPKWSKRRIAIEIAKTSEFRFGTIYKRI